MTKEDLIARLSIVFEKCEGYPDGGYHILLLDGGDQIGTEDAPNEMIVDFTNEALIENAELPVADAKLLQQYEADIKAWLINQGWTPIPS